MYDLIWCDTVVILGKFLGRYIYCNAHAVVETACRGALFSLTAVKSKTRVFLPRGLMSLSALRRLTANCRTHIVQGRVHEDLVDPPAVWQACPDQYL